MQPVERHWMTLKRKSGLQKGQNQQDANHSTIHKLRITINKLSSIPEDKKSNKNIFKKLI